MASEGSSPQPVPDIWSLADLCTPWCLHAVVTLRIADHIAAGTEQIEDLAAAARCDAYVLHRMLEHLQRKGVFHQPEEGRFTLNEAARQLLEPGLRLGMDLDGLGGRFAYAWGSMLSYVRSGASAYHEIFGKSFWEDLDAHPRLAEEFDALIGPPGHGMPDPDFPLTGGWDRVRSVIDVGGGTGAMLAGILRQRPHIRGTLVDLPRTVARSAEVFHQAGVTERAAVVGQSFFDPLPAGADLYLLRGVINDWADREAESILRRCAEAARPDGRVVVLKGVVPSGRPRPLMIEMMLVSGKSRTVDEFRELAGRAGLEVIAAGQAASYFAVECRPL